MASLRRDVAQFTKRRSTRAAAQRLSSLSPEQAVRRLERLGITRAADLLEAMPPDAAAPVLRLLRADLSRSYLLCMKRFRAARILEQLPPYRAAELLHRVGPPRAAELRRAMDAEFVAAADAAVVSWSPGPASLGGPGAGYDLARSRPWRWAALAAATVAMVEAVRSAVTAIGGGEPWGWLLLSIPVFLLAAFGFVMLTQMKTGRIIYAVVCFTGYCATAAGLELIPHHLPTAILLTGVLVCVLTASVVSIIPLESVTPKDEPADRRPESDLGPDPDSGPATVTATADP